VLGVAVLAVFGNLSLNHRTEAQSDQSVIFSFLKNHPQLNLNLLAVSDTTTVLAKSDQLIASTQATASSIVLTSSTTESKTSEPMTILDDVIMKTNPADTQIVYHEGLTKYTVTPGDTISGIASSFGISPQTVMMENKMDETSILKPGQELTILPMTGITYTLKDGDTLEGILNKYKITEDDFLNANNLESFEDLNIGSVAVIPLEAVSLPNKPKPATQFANSSSGAVALKQAAVPAGFVGSELINFIWPTPAKTISQGYHSRHTGLDISDSRKEPIYASSDGFVEISGYQANGYGNTIVINHGNGFKTRYAHASELFVQAGDFVKQGQEIAKQGRTGRVRGVTGIHLHFEIIKNGVKVNPLAYVKP